MNTQQDQNRLFAGLFNGQLNEESRDLSSNQICRENIPVEKNAEPPDDTRQSAECLSALASLTRNREMTFLISEAMERIENRTYGWCAECEKAIGEKRLTALPWARRCLDCQDAADRSNVEACREDAA